VDCQPFYPMIFSRPPM